MRSRVPAAVRGAALEAVALGRRLTAAQIVVLRDVGYSVGDRRQPPRDRPWGPADRALILRLAHTRGWSVPAIAVFLQRREAQVQAILSGARPENKVGRLRAHRRVPRRLHAPARWTTP